MRPLQLNVNIVPLRNHIGIRNEGVIAPIYLI